MSNIPENLRYSRDHEWLSIDGEHASVGITDYAQSSLGDVVFLDLPRVGDRFDAHAGFGSVESVKAVSEIFMPVGGTVTEVNDGINESPEVVNQDPYGGAWIIRIKIDKPDDIDKLMSAAEYEDFISSE
jgi:glycine cleavage system H protein